MVRPSLSPLMTNPDERDVVVDIAGDHATEAAVQRWLTSPVMERKSIQGSSKYSEIQNFEYQGQSNETSRNRANPTAGVAKRGKCLVRERLKQKARMEQQNKASVGDIDSNSLCSSVSPSKSESSHKQIDIRGMAKEPGNITPSTAASTRSYSSKSFSVANSSAKLTISDSSASPVENPQWTPRSLNSTHAQHVRRSIEIPELDSSRYPRYPVPPKLSVYNTASQPSSPGSRLSSSSGSSSPRSTLSNKYPGITQSFGSNSTAGRSSSRQLTPVTSSSERYYSGPRLRQNKIVISRQSQCSQQDSDEEREKPDIATPQRAQTHSSDHRQQQTPCIGRSNRIKLHVYDLIAQETVMQLPWGCHFPIGQCFNALNSGLHTLGTGAYHVGIEVRTQYFGIRCWGDINSILLLSRTD